MAKIIQPEHNRIEFTANLGFGEVVIAFIDFSDAGISFGIPHNILIHEGTPEEPSEKVVIREYERITVHADGKVVTHWALPPGNYFTTPWDTTRSPLASWDVPWSLQEGLSWTPDYIRFTKHYFTKPKTPSHKTCLRVPIMFMDQVSESTIYFAVVKPTDKISEVQQIIPLKGQVYVINGGWPWVIVAMSNIETPRVVELPTVGRDYR